MFRYVFFLLLLITSLNAQQFNPLVGLAPLGSGLDTKYKNLNSNEQIKVWIYLKDKGSLEKQMPLDAKSFLTEKAIARRAKTLGANKVFDSRDLPVSQNYVNILSGNVLKIRQTSKLEFNRWFVKSHAVNTIIEEPASIISSSLYSYNNNQYVVAAIIEPGKGYCVKVSSNCQLILKK